MPRGGHRENAGRKSGWVHGETQVIRVPKSIAPQLLELAKRLDKGESFDSEANSNLNDSCIEGRLEEDLVTESIKHILSSWRSRADSASPKNADWRKARQILSELEPVVYEGKVLESVAKSKDHPDQMDFLDQLSNVPSSELVTDSEDGILDSDTESEIASNDFVADSEEWLSTKECWSRLGCPGSYENFRKLSPDKLRNTYGVVADLSKRKLGRYNCKWLKLLNSA